MPWLCSRLQQFSVPFRMNYYSLWNRFTVNDLESFYPAIKALQNTLDVQYNKLMRLSKGESEVSLSFFIERELKSPDSSVVRSLNQFYSVANSRRMRNSRNMSESAKVLPAVVSLNALYEAIHTRKNIDAVLARLYMKHYLYDIVEYVESQIENVESYTNSNINYNNDPYGFGAFELRRLPQSRQPMTRRAKAKQRH